MCGDDDLRAIYRSQYSTSLARFRRNTAQAKDAYLRGFCAENTRKCTFSEPYREAFGRTRTELVLPPLVRVDGSRTATHLESAALLLRTEVAVDDPATDEEAHWSVRESARAPYRTKSRDARFSALELQSVIKQMRPFGTGPRRNNAVSVEGNSQSYSIKSPREIDEDEFSRFLSDSSNKVPVPARNFVMSRVFELAAFSSDLREDAASERGAALALQGQLVETRREMAALQRRVHEAESGLPGAVAADPTRRAGAPSPVPAAPQGALSYAAVLAGPGAAARGPHLPGREPADMVIPAVREEQHRHVAFLTPSNHTTAPARDVLRLLKTNIDPASKGIIKVTLRLDRLFQQ
ncbi:hypothetical protein HPB50_014598 [Hyalomma asiaticum]|uniref:Uncharacterized protein n=1 Tax=Hyalomma asiaticum TaxID=266040 RepID=A0ACB7T5C3_HYAAI|nr:hypothetical protein HPB50_014598 [Hyalomma asiaticum]